MKRLVTLLVLVLVSAPALAQVPQDIPDGNGRNLGEEQEERRTEAFREELQHLYVATQVGAGTSLEARRAATLGAHQAVGIAFDSGHILSLAVDVYHVPGATGAPDFLAETGFLDHTRSFDRSVAVVSMQYHHNLRHLAPRSEHARRTTVALGYGVASGGNQGMTFTLTPAYTLPVNRYWSMPLGVKVSYLLMDGGASVAQRTFVGLQIGVRLHPFGHRDRLE